MRRLPENSEPVFPDNLSSGEKVWYGMERGIVVIQEIEIFRDILSDDIQGLY